MGDIKKNRLHNRYSHFTKEHLSFYHSAEWKRKRKEILLRDNYECQKCKQQGRYARAQCVHHKRHVDKAWALRLVDSNLISLCNVCHNEEHPEKREAMAGDRERRFFVEERWE